MPDDEDPSRESGDERPISLAIIEPDGRLERVSEILEQAGGITRLIRGIDYAPLPRLSRAQIEEFIQRGRNRDFSQFVDRILAGTLGTPRQSPSHSWILDDLRGVAESENEDPPEPTLWEEFKHSPRFVIGQYWNRLRRHFSLSSWWPHLSDSPRARRETRWLGLFRLVLEGDDFPRFYGIAWRDYYNGRCWCMPIPLNLFVGALLWTWSKVKRGIEDGEFARRYEIADLQRQVRNWEAADTAMMASRVNACLICGGPPSSLEHQLAFFGSTAAYHAYTPGFPWDSVEVGWDHEKVRPLDDQECVEE